MKKILITLIMIILLSLYPISETMKAINANEYCDEKGYVGYEHIGGITSDEFRCFNTVVANLGYEYSYSGILTYSEVRELTKQEMKK